MERLRNKFNSWNHETSTTALRLNDRHCNWVQAAQECRALAPSHIRVIEGYWSVKEATRFMLVDRLKETVSVALPKVDVALARDLTRAALERIHWHDIADYYLAELPQEEGPRA
jgi:hypothetical protein